MGVQEKWEILTNAIWDVGREIKMVKEIGNWKGGERDVDIKAQKRKTWAALKKWVKRRKEKDREELKRERKKLKEIMRIKKDEEREKKRSRLENCRSISEFWGGARREFRGGRKRKGESIEKDRWEENFKGLLGGVIERVEGRERGEFRGEETGYEVMDREISLEEVERTLGAMKNGKAAGEDGIAVEFLKYLPRDWIKLAWIINNIFLGKEMIKGWEVARIYPIHKGGDEEEVKNYRGVFLLDSGYKLLAVILERRLRLWLEKMGN